jgi:hypothetical protein
MNELSKKRKIPKLPDFEQLDKRRRSDSDQDSFFEDEDEEEETHAQPPQQYQQQQYQPQVVKGFPQSRSTLPIFEQQQQKKQRHPFGKSPKESVKEKVGWTIDRTPQLPLLQIGEPPNWTKRDEYDFPIWGQIQGSIDTSAGLQRDTKPRRITVKESIPPEVLDVYDFINTYNNDFITGATQCKMPTNSTFKKADKARNPVCCGFTASVMSAILYILLQTCHRGRLTKNCLDNFKRKLQLSITLTNKKEEIKINSTNMYSKILRFFILISGYADLKNIGWNFRCPSKSHNLAEGINLISLTDDIQLSGCTTYHHFTVFVMNEYSIIFDTWAGGRINGCRGSWVRIMITSDLENLFKLINDNPTDYALLTTLFSIYFNSPDLSGLYEVDHHVQVGILNKDTGLYDTIWKYLYGTDISGSSSVFAGPQTQEYMEKMEDSSQPQSSQSSQSSQNSIQLENEGTQYEGTQEGTQYEGTQEGTQYEGTQEGTQYEETQDEKLNQLIHALGELSQSQGQGFGIKKRNKKTKRKSRRKTRRKRSKSNKKIKKKKNIDEMYEEIL